MKTARQGENRGPNGFSCLNLNRMGVSLQFFYLPSLRLHFCLNSLLCQVLSK
jgi:hypothetical protein